MRSVITGAPLLDVGCGGRLLSADLVELAHLLVERPGGQDALHGRGQTGLRTCGVAQFGLLFGSRGDDDLGNDRGILAVLDGVGDELLGDLAARVVGLDA